MSFHKNYRIPFWRGFLHASLVVLVLLFVSFIWLSISAALSGVIVPVVSVFIALFVGILLLALCMYVIFFEPMKYIVHHHFKAASVLIISTLGWLFIYFLLFVFGLVFTFYS